MRETISRPLLAWMIPLVAMASACAPRPDIRDTNSATLTSAPLPTVNSARTPAPNYIATRLAGSAPSTPGATETYGPTPDIAATLVAQVGAELQSSYSSPDGKWRAEIRTYACTELTQEEEYGLHILRIINTQDGSEREAARQLLNCGGLGAAGLGGWFWSTNSRFFYYTDASTGVPDGCGYWVSLPPKTGPRAKVER